MTKEFENEIWLMEKKSLFSEQFSSGLIFTSGRTCTTSKTRQRTLNFNKVNLVMKIDMEFDLTLSNKISGTIRAEL